MKRDSVTAESKIRTRRQNMKLVKRTVIISSFTLLPWLPNFFVTIFATVASLVDYDWYDEKTKGILDEWLILNDLSVYLYFSVPWIYPLLNILMEPNIRKGIKGFKRYGRFLLLVGFIAR